MEYIISPAAEGDAAGLLAVYGQYIETPITFEETLPDEAAFRERIRTTMRRYPYLVARACGAPDSSRHAGSDGADTVWTTNGEQRADTSDAAQTVCGAPIAYAYAGPFARRASYRWSVEFSVYIAREHTGRGLGRRLYGELLRLLAAQGYRTAYGIVTAGNPASDGLHRAMGFAEAGRVHRAGYKNGWRDVIYYEKPLGAYDDNSPPREPDGAWRRYLTP